MSLTTQGFNSLNQNIGVSQAALLQQNYDAQSLQPHEQGSSLIDHSIEGNRLYEKFDGTIELDEKPIGYIIGERVLAPAINAVSFSVRGVFSFIGSGLSSIHNFQVLPMAAAEEIPSDSESCTLQNVQTNRGFWCNNSPNREC